MEKNDLIHLMNQNNFIILNKTLAHNVGIVSALIIGELCSEYEYWQKQNKLVEGEYFFSTIKNMENQLGIPQRTQFRKIKELEKLGIIKTKLMDIPAKRYFAINIEELVKYLK